MADSKTKNSELNRRELGWMERSPRGASSRLLLFRRRVVVLFFLSLLFRLLLVLGLELLRHLPELLVHEEVQRAFGIRAVCLAVSGRKSGQDLERLIDGLDGIDLELAGLHRIDYFFPEHQVLYVQLRDDHALVAGEPLALAHGKEPFDLFVHAADGLDLAHLADRTGDGKVLFHRNVGNAGDDGHELGCRRAVSLDLAVALLEGETRRERERLVLRVFAGQVPRKDQHTLAVDAARELRLALDVEDACLAEIHPRGDARRPAEREVADIIDREAVHLTDDGACYIDHDGTVGEELLNPLFEEVRAVYLFFERLVHVFAPDDRTACLRRPIRRFPDEVGKVAEAERELSFFLGKTHGKVHDARSCRAREPQQALR